MTGGEDYGPEDYVIPDDKRLHQWRNKTGGKQREGILKSRLLSDSLALSPTLSLSHASLSCSLRFCSSSARLSISTFFIRISYLSTPLPPLLLLPSVSLCSSFPSGSLCPSSPLFFLLLFLLLSSTNRTRFFSVLGP